MSLPVLLKRIIIWIGAISSSDESFSSPSCDIFLAPSTLDNGGWGVFAARDFQESEVVEHAPLYITFPPKHALVKNSVLDDYDYGIRRSDGESYAAITLGMVMFYNHDEEPNVAYTASLGRGEPSWEDPMSMTQLGFVTRRAISEGEELFSTYGFGQDGPRWFATRRIPMKHPTPGESTIPPDQLDDYRNRFCSKIYVGPGKTTYHDRVKPADQFYLFQTNSLPNADAPTAIAKTSIQKGERIEIAPGLVLPKADVFGTALAPLVFTWNDLQQDHRKALRDLRIAGQFKVQHQSPETDWHRIDRFENFQRAVIFPVAGSIGTIERVGNANPNCEMKIQSSGSGEGSAGLVLEIVALQDIYKGEALRLNIPPTGTEAEKKLLVEILESTGQLVPDSLRPRLATSNEDNEL